MELEWAIDVLFRIVNYEISFFAWFEMVWKGLKEKKYGDCRI